MKKFLALILAAAMLLSCALAETAEEPVDEAAVQNGVYNITNATGATVADVILTDNVTGSSIAYSREGGLKDGESMNIGFSIPAGEDGKHRLTLQYTVKTSENTYTVYSFTTLSIEEVGITLLAADAITGATPIAFTGATETQDGYYVLRNATGATVADVILTDNVTGSSIAFSIEGGLKDGESMGIGFSIPAGEDGKHRLTLQYTVETGENTYTVYSFTTLSIEEATLELLSPDAITGATPFRFVMDQQ